MTILSRVLALVAATAVAGTIIPVLMGDSPVPRWRFAAALLTGAVAAYIAVAAIDRRGNSPRQ